MIFVVSKAIEYIKNQILDRVVSHRRLLGIYLLTSFCKRLRASGMCCALGAIFNGMLSLLLTSKGFMNGSILVCRGGAIR